MLKSGVTQRGGPIYSNGPRAASRHAAQATTFERSSPDIRVRQSLTSIAATVLIATACPGAPAQQASPAASATADDPAVRPLRFGDADRLLVERNRPVRLARSAVEIASAEIRRVDVLPNPVLSGQVSNTVAGQYRVRESDRLARIEQTFERGGKRELRREFAEQARRAAVFDLAETVRQQRTALAGAYFELAARQRLVGIARDVAAGYTRLLDAAERRRRAGDLAAVDVSRLRVEASRADSDARAAEAEQLQARLALAALLALETEAGALVAADDLPDTVDGDRLPGDSAAAPDLTPARDAAALSARADVLAAAQRARAAEQAVRLAQAQRTRDVTVGLQTERVPAFGGNVYGVTASVPLFLNNDFGGDIARASAELEQAREDEGKIRAAARSDIDRARAQLALSRDQLSRILSTTLPQANRAVEAIEFAFTRGAATLTDLFDARRQWAAVRTDAVGAQRDFARALATMRLALSTEETR